MISFIQWRFFFLSASPLPYCVFERKFLVSLKALLLLFSVFSWGVQLFKGLNWFRSVKCFLLLLFFFSFFWVISSPFDGVEKVKRNG